MISPWRLQLQPASFRGVPFFVRSSERPVGRRTVLFEYPQRDEPFTEDLGRKAREFTLEAIIIGPDYFKARDALEAALEMRGPGTLVHPYRGSMEVSLLQPARISESSDEGGMARFNMTFVEGGQNIQPSTRVDTRTKVDQAANNAGSAISEDFSKAFSVDNVPDFVEASALDIANDITKAMNDVRAGIIPDLTIIAEYSAAAYGVANSLGALIRSPADFAFNLLSLVQGLGGLARSPLASLDALKQLFNYGDDLKPVPTTTVVRRAQAANQTALVSFVRQAAVVEAARAA